MGVEGGKGVPAFHVVFLCFVCWVGYSFLPGLSLSLSLSLKSILFLLLRFHKYC